MTTRNCFLKMCDKTSSPLDIIIRRCFFSHKPRQIGCVGFVGQGRVRLPPILSRDTGRNRARQIFIIMSLLFFISDNAVKSNMSGGNVHITSKDIELCQQ